MNPLFSIHMSEMSEQIANRIDKEINYWWGREKLAKELFARILERADLYDLHLPDCSIFDPDAELLCDCGTNNLLSEVYEYINHNERK